MKKGQVEDWTDFMITFFLLLLILVSMSLVFGKTREKVAGEIKLNKENFRLNSEMLSYLRMNSDGREIRDLMSESKIENNEEKIDKFREKSAGMFNEVYGVRWSVNVVIPDKDFKANQFRSFVGRVVNLAKVIESYKGALFGTNIISSIAGGVGGVVGKGAFVYYAGDDVFNKLLEGQKDFLVVCDYVVLTEVVPLAYSEQKYGVVNLVLCEE